MLHSLFEADKQIVSLLQVHTATPYQPVDRSVSQQLSQ